MDLSTGVKNESANYANWRDLERRKLFWRPDLKVGHDVRSAHANDSLPRRLLN